MRDSPSTSIENYVLYSAIQVLLFKEGKEKNLFIVQPPPTTNESRESFRRELRRRMLEARRARRNADYARLVLQAADARREGSSANSSSFQHSSSSEFIPVQDTPSSGSVCD